MSSRPRPVACFLAVVVSCGAAALPPPPQDPPGARLPADFQRGVNHAHIHRRGHGYGSARSAEELAALRALGVNWIAITPFGYQDGATADEIAGFPGREGPSEFFSRSDPSMTDTDLAREIAAAHWDEEDDRIGFWDALDFIGVNAYFPLDAPAGATAEELVAAWAPHKARLARLAARMGKGIIFTEVGYRPVADAHREPWRYEGGADDPGAQGRAYEALFRSFANEPGWRGAYIWKTFTDPDVAARRGDAPAFSFRGRPAEEAVRRWYGGGHAERPATWPQTRNSDRISNR